MKEYIVNIFLYIDANRIMREIGAKWHMRRGTDAEKLAFLQAQVRKDYRSAFKRRLPDSVVLIRTDGSKELGAISYDSFRQLAAYGHLMNFLEDAVFKKCSFAPRQPLMVVTPIVDGAVMIEGIADLPTFTETTP